MRAIFTALAALPLVVLAGCSQAPAASRSDTPNPTIVSLNPCTDAILARVAGPDQLLAISHYSMNPSSSSMPADAAGNYAHTGGTVEEVLALDPDVVVAGSFLAPATRTALTDLGIRVETFGIAATIDDSFAQVRRLAGLAGNRAGGEALVGQIEAALAAHADNEGVPVRTLVWQQGGIVPGEATLIDELLTRTGFASQTSARGLRQASHVSLEAMLADPPQLVFVAGEGRSLHHPAMDAMQDTQRAELPARMLYCGGPSIIEAAEYLGEIRRGFGAAQADERPS